MTIVPRFLPRLRRALSVRGYHHAPTMPLFSSIEDDMINTAAEQHRNRLR